VTWAIYRFSHAQLSQVTAIPDRVAAKTFGKSSNMTANVHKIVSRIPVPAPEIPDGIRTLRKQNRKGTRPTCWAISEREDSGTFSLWRWR